MRRIVYMMLLAGMLLACSERREYTEALTRAKAVLDERPDSALGILNTLLTHESRGTDGEGNICEDTKRLIAKGTILDRSGKIVGINVYGEELTKLLEE